MKKIRVCCSLKSTTLNLQLDRQYCSKLAGCVLAAHVETWNSNLVVFKFPQNIMDITSLFILLPWGNVGQSSSYLSAECIKQLKNFGFQWELPSVPRRRMPQITLYSARDCCGYIFLFDNNVLKYFIIVSLVRLQFFIAPTYGSKLPRSNWV